MNQKSKLFLQMYKLGLKLCWIGMIGLLIDLLIVKNLTLLVIFYIVLTLGIILIGPYIVFFKKLNQ